MFNSYVKLPEGRLKKKHDSFGSKPFKTWRLWCYDTSAVNEMPFINFINPSPKSPFLWMVLHPSKNETCLVYGIEFTTSDYPHLSPWYTTFVYFRGDFMVNSPLILLKNHHEHHPVDIQIMELRKNWSAAGPWKTCCALQPPFCFGFAEHLVDQGQWSQHLR